jgi:hypothetical protein
LSLLLRLTFSAATPSAVFNSLTVGVVAHNTRHGLWKDPLVKHPFDATHNSLTWIKVCCNGAYCRINDEGNKEKESKDRKNSGCSYERKRRNSHDLVIESQPSNSPKQTDVYHFAFSKYAAMISSRVSGLSADTCDFCEHVDFWLVAPKLILLFDKLGAADNVLELDRLSSRDRIVELS